VGFTALLITVCFGFLFPALYAKKRALATLQNPPHPTTAEARDLAALSAYSSLVLAVVLFIIVAGLILVFRVGRFFRPRVGGPRIVTQHVDAWAESAKRLDVPDADELQE